MLGRGAGDAAGHACAQDISYGVYLLHGPLIQLSLLTGLYRPGWLGLLGVLAVLFPLAYASPNGWSSGRGSTSGRRLGQWLGSEEKQAPPPRTAARRPAGR